MAVEGHIAVVGPQAVDFFVDFLVELLFDLLLCVLRAYPLFEDLRA